MARDPTRVKVKRGEGGAGILVQVAERITAMIVGDPTKGRAGSGAARNAVKTTDPDTVEDPLYGVVTAQDEAGDLAGRAGFFAGQPDHLEPGAGFGIGSVLEAGTSPILRTHKPTRNPAME